MPILPLHEEADEGYKSRVDLVDDIIPHETFLNSHEDVVVVEISPQVYYVREIWKQQSDEGVVLKTGFVSGAGLAHAIAAIFQEVQECRQRAHIENIFPGDNYGSSPRSYIIVIERQGSRETDI